MNRKQLENRIKVQNRIIKRQNKIIVTQRQIIRSIKRKNQSIPNRKQPKAKQIRLISEQEQPKQIRRRQVAYSFKADYPPYFISIRVLTYNPEYSERYLLITLDNIKRNFELRYNLHLKYDYTGFENKPIGSNDIEFHDDKIHYDIFMGGKNGVKESGVTQ